MGIRDVIAATLRLLNQVEVRGESNIAALGAAISNLKGMQDAFARKKEEDDDHHDKRWEDDPN